MILKEIRNDKQLTQQEASKILGISLRSYVTYENDDDKIDSKKYIRYCDELNRHISIDEDHGLLTIDKIKKIVFDIFKKYDIKFCYLFGSYAKHNETEKSDVDLLIDSSITGLKYFGLVEELRTSLMKKVDLIRVEDLLDNKELLLNVLSDGLKIYG